jgi:hypothetical protein
MVPDTGRSCTYSHNSFRFGVSGTSHNFIQHREVSELGLFPDPRNGSTHLMVGDDRVIQYDGPVVDVEIVTSTIKGGPSYIERSTFCTVDIGTDDIILEGEESTRLVYTGLYGELEHLKIKTSLIDEMFPSVMSECMMWGLL